MATKEFVLADIGEGTQEAEILRWIVREGQDVREDDPLVEIQTDKVTTELPSPWRGRVAKILSEAGSVVPVGTALVEIEVEGAASASAAGPEATPRQATEFSKTLPPPSPTPPAGGAGKALAAPAVRKRARELGVNLQDVPGSGPGGRISMEDLEAFSKGPKPISTPSLAATPSPPAPGPLPPEGGSERIPLRGLRRVIAKNMAESSFTIPHALSIDDADVTELARLRERTNRLLAEEGGEEVPRLTFLPYIVKALGHALRSHPMANAHFDDAAGEIVAFSDVNIGIATDTPDGLIVPVVHHVESLTLLDLAREIRRLTDGARRRTIVQEDLDGGTITVTNHGAIGGLYGSPIIRKPEVAVVGIGRIRDEAVVVEGQLEVRTILHYSIAFDHRVLDGGEAARLGNDMARLLTHPELLFARMS